jgi:hypothetical protein
VTTLFAGRNIDNDPQVLFTNIIGRGLVINNVRSGLGHDGRGERGRGRGRGQNYTGSTNTTNKGLCGNLGTNVLDYDKNYSADLMRTMCYNLWQYVRTNYGRDISNELQNKITVDIIEPVHSAEVLRRHGLSYDLDKETCNGQ